MANNQVRSCDTCGAWSPPGDNEDMGQCRLNPPVGVPVGGDVVFHFPETAAHHWCAKFAKKGAKFSTVDGGKD